MADSPVRTSESGRDLSEGVAASSLDLSRVVGGVGGVAGDAMKEEEKEAAERDAKAEVVTCPNLKEVEDGTVTDGAVCVGVSDKNAVGNGREQWTGAMEGSLLLSAGSEGDIVDLKTCLLANFENERKEDGCGKGGVESIDSVGGDSGCCDNEIILNETRDIQRTCNIELEVKNVAFGSIALEGKTRRTTAEDKVESCNGNKLDEVGCVDVGKEVGVSNKIVGVANVTSVEVLNVTTSEEEMGTDRIKCLKSVKTSKQSCNRQLTKPGTYKGVVRGRLQKPKHTTVPAAGNTKSDLSTINRG